MVKEEISICCTRIKLVFLPVRSPELNLIEVRWAWLQRQTINNSTFKDEREIGRTVIASGRISTIRIMAERA